MILTESFLRREDVLRHFRMDGGEVLHENQAMARQRSDRYDLFISHSYLDKPLIYTLVHLFNNAGYAVYVDWIEDPQLDRSHVTSTTAEAVKMRVQQSRGLAYIATGNTAKSKWCPWELGLGDGLLGKSCILPILEEESSVYQGVEYLGIYPYLTYHAGYGSGRSDFLVKYPQSNQFESLYQWLNH